MQTAEIQLQSSKPSMRRTLLTLLAAIGAFGVLTASYATAELPVDAATVTQDTAQR
jgi:hypothetical protein